MFKILELFIVMLATGIAWRALERNTKGILTNCSTQLFNADTQVEKEEFEGADRPLWTIYGRPDTTEPAGYCQQLLGAIAKHSKPLVNIPNAGALYEKLIELSPPEDQVQDIAELRRVKSHLTLILNELHSAYDFWSKGVMSKEELKTWLGYLPTIGPHPLFLAEIEHWRRARLQ